MFDKAIEIALRTWYPKNHNLHFNPHHPLGKLLGEWGELLDDYMKSIYKPGYEFEPLDELGDIWYYLRILSYQQNYEPVEFTNMSFLTDVSCYDTDGIIVFTMKEISRAFIDLKDTFNYSVFALDVCYCALLYICNKYDITIQQLTESNWEKLKPGSVRGNEWQRARVSTDYIGGKVAKIEKI